MEGINTKTFSFTLPPPENKVQNERKDQGIERTKKRIGTMKSLCGFPSSWSAGERTYPGPLVRETLWESVVRGTCLEGCVSMVMFALNFLSAALFEIQFMLHTAHPLKGYYSMLFNCIYRILQPSQ